MSYITVAVKMSKFVQLIIAEICPPVMEKVKFCHSFTFLRASHVRMAILESGGGKSRGVSPMQEVRT